MQINVKKMYLLVIDNDKRRVEHEPEALASWAMKSGWWTGARSIKDKKWTQTCGMQKQPLVGALGLLWKRLGVKDVTSLDAKIDNEALALALQSQGSFTSAEWDELQVN